MTYTVLDLYSGAGGAAMGYSLAGFNVIGVDNKSQPRYPFEFHRADALDFLRAMISHGWSGIDAIHASPPCQRHSIMSQCRPGLAKTYPDMIEPTRFLLRRIGLPYVIENVVGAPLDNPVMLCGTHFWREVSWPGHGIFDLQRHRLFETYPFTVPSPVEGECHHVFPSLPVYGNGAPGNRPELRGEGFTEVARAAMGTPWMNRNEMAEAVPPCYTHFVGEHLMAYLDDLAIAA